MEHEERDSQLLTETPMNSMLLPVIVSIWWHAVTSTMPWLAIFNPPKAETVVPATQNG